MAHASREAASRYNREWYQGNKEKKLAQGKLWAASNRDKRNKSLKSWRDSTIDVRRAYQNSWYAANKEKRLMQQKARRAAVGKDVKAAKYKQYYNENKVKINAQKVALRLKNIEKNRAAERKARGLPEPTRPDPGSCECCGSFLSLRTLALDHCHLSGQFRGWLCLDCNMAIGKLGDSIEGLEKAISYLRRFEDGRDNTASAA